MTVFMLIVTDMVPASSETIPLLGVFFTAVMIEMVLMVFVMCYVLKLHLMEPEDDEEISPFMRRFLYNYLSFKFRIRRNTDKEKEPRLKNGHANGMHAGAAANKQQQQLDDFNYKTANGSAGREDNTTAVLMEKNLKVMTEKMKEEEREKKLKHEFEVCAQTLDILAMIVFVTVFILITVVYLLITTS
jgi:Neurotransmitter-gated ion-channel transmembrane region.